MENDIIIRPERKEEHRAVEALVRDAFWNVYQPGCVEHYLVHRLRNDPAFVPELDFVMEKGGRIIGHIMYMRAVICADDRRDVPIMTMGPISIAPEFQRRGYGKTLLDFAGEGGGAQLRRGVHRRHRLYGKSGFFASRFGIRYHGLPEGADALLTLQELQPGYLDGIWGLRPAGLHWMKTKPWSLTELPPRERLRLPGQIFQA